MATDTLRAEHRRILDAIDSLEALIARPRPDTPDALFRDRWSFTRDLMLHLSQDDTHVLRPLMADRRPHVAALARKSSEQISTLYSAFQTHAVRWQGFPGEAEWSEYRVAVRRLMRRFRALIVDEEAKLYQFLPAQPVANAEITPSANYAGAAWDIRELIYPAESKKAG